MSNSSQFNQLSNIIDYVNNNFIDSNNAECAKNNLINFTNWLKEEQFVINNDDWNYLVRRNTILYNSLKVYCSVYHEKDVSNIFLRQLLSVYRKYNKSSIKSLNWQDIINSLNESIESYHQKIIKIPLLTLDEEKEVAKRIENGDQEARDLLIIANLRIPYSQALHFHNEKIALEDLIQEGNIGLIEAVDKYDVNLGVPFFSYAIKWVQKYIFEYFANFSQGVRLPYGVHAFKLQREKLVNKLAIILGREPKDEEISEALKMDLETYNDLNNNIKQFISLNTPVQDDEAIELCDIIAVHEIPVSDFVVNKIMQEKVNHLLNSSDLSKLEKKAVLVILGLDDGECLRLSSFAKKANISKEWASQLAKRALNKIILNPESDTLAYLTKNPSESLEYIRDLRLSLKMTKRDMNKRINNLIKMVEFIGYHELEKNISSNSLQTLNLVLENPDQDFLMNSLRLKKLDLYILINRLIKECSEVKQKVLLRCRKNVP